MSKKKVLITGITGFAGSHLADLILEKGEYELYGFKRWHLSSMRNVRHIVDKVTWFDVDVTDPIGCKKALDKIRPDYIFHLAAESFVSPSWDHPSHYMDVNYMGTVNMLEAMKELGLKETRILLPGSGEEYGEIYEHEVPITEETVLRPVNPYAVTKVAQDLIGFVYYKSFGLNVVRTRAFNHEGPRRHHVFGIAWYAYQVARIEAGLQEAVIRTGHTSDRRNFTHIRDLVTAYFMAMEKCQAGELYLIGSEDESRIFTFQEVAEKLAKMSTVQGITTQVDQQFVRPTSVPRLIGDCSKFGNLTGWKPEISFDQTLQDILDYWRDYVKKDLY